MQIPEAVDLLFGRFGRDVDQRGAVRLAGEMSVDRVMAEVSGATRKTACERRTAVVADLLRRGLPIDQAHLLGPESVPVFERTTMEVWVIHVRVSSAVRFDNRGCHARSRSSAAALRE